MVVSGCWNRPVWRSPAEVRKVNSVSRKVALALTPKPSKGAGSMVRACWKPSSMPRISADWAFIGVETRTSSRPRPTSMRWTELRLKISLSIDLVKTATEIRPSVG
ncbi:hypothetical protein D3C75_1026390 [compost metagenome]